MKSICPKCGGNAYLERYNDRWMIRCAKCNEQTGLYPEKEIALKEWNLKCGVAVSASTTNI